MNRGSLTRRHSQAITAQALGIQARPHGFALEPELWQALEVEQEQTLGRGQEQKQGQEQQPELESERGQELEPGVPSLENPWPSSRP